MPQRAVLQLRTSLRIKTVLVLAFMKDIRSNDMPLSPPAAIIAGGETTVKVTGNGRGGRSQEFVLSAAMTMPQAQSQIASR